MSKEICSYSVVPDHRQQKPEDETVLLYNPKKTFTERRIAKFFMILWPLQVGLENWDILGCGIAEVFWKPRLL